MKGNVMNNASIQIVPFFLGLVIAWIVYATVAGRSLPLISGPRAALIALLVIGMAMCTSGIGQVGASGRWLSPLAILGYLLGAAIFIVIIGAFAGWKLPLIQNDTQSVVAVGILIAVKFVIGTAGSFLHWL